VFALARIEDIPQSSHFVKTVMSTRILVGNIPVDATEDSLKEFFEAIGRVRDIVLPRNERGQAKGFASIAMHSRKEAVEARQLALMDYRGRKLTISLMQEEPDVSKKGVMPFLQNFFRR